MRKGPKDNLRRALADVPEHCRVPVRQFAVLFLSGRNRPSVPGEVIASVLVLQTRQDCSGAEAMRALRHPADGGLPIDHEGFHPRR